MTGWLVLGTVGGSRDKKRSRDANLIRQEAGGGNASVRRRTSGTTSLRTFKQWLLCAVLCVLEVLTQVAGC